VKVPEIRSYLINKLGLNKWRLVQN
jgi:hypothetical protein